MNTVSISSILQQVMEASPSQPLLATSKRGIEREGLRVSRIHQQLAATTHPQAYGSKLTHPHITTDYAESLLEIITAAHPSIEANMQEATWWHRAVLAGLPQNEYLWGYSMPCPLPDDASIPIASYGMSAEAQMKTVYREGLAVRYGKHMQCIAGLHYNFSLSADMWPLLANLRGDQVGSAAYQQASASGYMYLVRNVIQHASILLYLFGASPALHQSFRAPLAHAEAWKDTLFLPYATSLRMSDIGYQSAEQKQCLPRWSDLGSYIHDLFHMVSEPSTTFSAYGLEREGKRIQLNTNRLQLENEFYAPIRPKAIPQNDRPLMALWHRGVEYIELRCIDIDPFSPVGISTETSYFLEIFLTWCALAPETPFTDNTCHEVRARFAAAAQQGRDPHLEVMVAERMVNFRDWTMQVLTQLMPVAQTLDALHQTQRYQTALQAQIDKVEKPEQTPSAQVLTQMHRTNSLVDWVDALSQKHNATLMGSNLWTAQDQQRADAQQRASLAAFEQTEQQSHQSLEEYLQAYDAQFDELRNAFGELKNG